MPRETCCAVYSPCNVSMPASFCSPT